MADYTKKNVSELKDSAPQFGFDEIAEARFPQKELDATQAGFAHHRLKSDKRQAFGHQHEEAEEICFVVSGSGRVKLDDELVELEQGDFLRVAPEVKRRFEAGPEGLEYLVFGAHHEKDGDLDPEFWAPDGGDG
jgi:mannose-6-phosphate isomerase-like protein (cupin superfamily)